MRHERVPIFNDSAAAAHRKLEERIAELEAELTITTRSRNSWEEDWKIAATNAKDRDDWKLRCEKLGEVVRAEKKWRAILEQRIVALEADKEQLVNELHSRTTERDDYKRRWEELHSVAGENVRLREAIQKACTDTGCLNSYTEASCDPAEPGCPMCILETALRGE